MQPGSEDWFQPDSFRLPDAIVVTGAGFGFATGRKPPTAKDGAGRKTGSKVPKQGQESETTHSKRQRAPQTEGWRWRKILKKVSKKRTRRLRSRSCGFKIPSSPWVEPVKSSFAWLQVGRRVAAACTRSVAAVESGLMIVMGALGAGCIAMGQDRPQA